MAQNANTSIVRFEPEMLREKLFHGAQATIIDVQFDQNGKLVFTVAGPDVPGAAEVRIVYVQAVTADATGARSITTAARFEPVA